VRSTRSPVRFPTRTFAIQWDLARETAAVEGVEFQFADSELSRLPSDPMERYRHALSELSPRIADDVWLGLHVCYAIAMMEPVAGTTAWLTKGPRRAYANARVRGAWPG
jgi:hypothetical protein